MATNAQSFETTASLKAKALGPGAEVRLTVSQVWFLLGSVCLVILGGLVFSIDLIGYMQLFVAISTCFFATMIVFSMTVALRGAQEDSLINVSDEEALEMVNNHPEQLPVIVSIMAAFHEQAVAEQQCVASKALVYPVEKRIEVVVFEEGDTETISAYQKYASASVIILIRPRGSGPMTKPGAMNWAFEQIVRFYKPRKGDLTVVFDAEDIPEPLQLVKAAIAMKKAQAIDPKVACVQARLAFTHNAKKNLVTRLLSLDYIQHFGLILPGLSSLGVVSPLGGTSNYILTSVLLQYLWDAHNVTEDLNLAVFLLRDGWLTRVFESVTAEEAVEDILSFVKQRSRWIKGGMQTYFRHMRNPIQLYKDLGVKRFISFQCVVGAPLVLYLINPFFWALTAIYATTHATWIQELYPSVVFYIASACFVFGNAAYLYFLQVAAFKTKNFGTVIFAFLAPLYWLVLSVAGYKALIEFAKSKKGASKWSKTAHKGVKK